MTKKRNRIGAISLTIAAVGFLLVSFQPWLRLDSVILFSGLTLKHLLAAFFDAALVGSLADWFAVSALFRDPLGIRLPHTNILAKNKDAIAEAVPRFITLFVSDDRIAVELKRLDFAAKIEEALSGGGLRAELHEFLSSRASAFLRGYAGGEGPGPKASAISSPGSPISRPSGWIPPPPSRVCCDGPARSASTSVSSRLSPISSEPKSAATASSWPHR